MVSKNFTDVDGNELRTFLNKDNLCFIEISSDAERSGYYTGFICLDLNDLSEFINELIDIKKQMQ